MEAQRVVRENLGYALLGGPALAAVSFAAGAAVVGTVAGVVAAFATYALGWALVAGGSESAPKRSRSDADDERDRREREAEAGKGGFGGGGSGG